MQSDSRRRDTRRSKKAVDLDSDEESGGEEQLQPRASHHPKKSPKPPNGNIIIKGDVHIKNVKGNFNLIQGRRDEPRTQRSATPTRNPPRRLQLSRATKPATIQCDSPSASDEDVTNGSDDSEPEHVAPKRSARSMNPPERPRMHSEKKKRDQADEGYHTSGTYTAEGYKHSGKGKERSTSSSTGESSSSHPRLWSSAASRESPGGGSETDPTSCHSDPGEEDQEIDDGGNSDRDEEEEDASDDVCFP
jgi:hypothetical protein